MKAFLEEYGVVVVAAIVIMIIVVLATPLGNKIRDGIVSTVTKLTDKMNTGLNVSDNSALTPHPSCLLYTSPSPRDQA